MKLVEQFNQHKQANKRENRIGKKKGKERREHCTEIPQL